MANKLNELLGVQPELREYLAGIEGALNGDLVMVIDPETVGSATTVETRDIIVSITNAAGDIQRWVNDTFATTVSKADVTDGDGTSAVDSATLTIVDGVGTITVTYTGAWATDDTETVTIAAITLAGISVTGGTSVDTIA